MDSVVSVKATGLVYRNPGPDAEDIQVQHPSLVLLSENEMLATFDLDRRGRPLDYRTVAARSTDGGETWTREGSLLKETPLGTTHSIRTARLSDGSLIGLGIMDHRDDPGRGVVNPETFGRVPSELFLARSTDAGRSWTGPEYIEPPLIGPSWEICHPILELADGRLLTPTATWRGWNGESPSGEQSPVFISDDGGETWPVFGRSFDGRATGLSHWEQSVAQLEDGRLLAVSWVYDLRTGQTPPTEYSISEDRGETFSASKRTSFHAQTCKIIQLREGRVLCAYRRHDLPGLWATLARVGYDSWTNLGHVALWEGAESGMVGEGRPADELKGLKFGYPSMKQLPSGDVLLLFWCEEEGVTHIRWLRLRVG